MREALWRNAVTIAASFVELTAASLLLTNQIPQAVLLALTGIVVSLALDGELSSRRSVRWFIGSRRNTISPWRG